MTKTGGLRRILIFLLVPLLLGALTYKPHLAVHANQAAAQTQIPSPEDHYPNIQILEADREGIVLEFTSPEADFIPANLDGQACEKLELPGLALTDQPATPALPVQGAMLGIPQDAQPVLKILAAEWTALPGEHLLCPTPRPNLTRSARSPWQLDGYSYEFGPAYQIDGFAPGNAAEFVSTGNLRSQRFAQIRFNPIQYNPVSRELRYFSRIQVEVEFNVRQTVSLPNIDSNRQANSLSYLAEGYFEDSLKSLLLNYEQARSWRSMPTTSPQIDSITAPQSDPSYKIEVNQDGLYKVTYGDLQTAGVPTATLNSLDPRTFKLVNQGVEAALLVEGEADGIFHSSDYLLFYGQKVNTKYTDTNVYWLSWGGANGVRMTSLNGAPSGSASVANEFFTTQHIEENWDYYSEEPSGPDSDHWYWWMVDAYSAPDSYDFTTELYHLADGSQTATLRGLLNGYYGEPNHHTKIYVNGHLVDDHSFAAGSEYNLEVYFPQTYLLEGTNTITVECPRDGSITLDEVLVNWFEIDYNDTYFAENNRLFFDGEYSGISKPNPNNGLPSVAEYNVDGFSASDIEVYDITDPLSVVKIAGATVEPTVNGQQLVFETTITEEHHYLAQTTAQRLSPLDIYADSPSNWKTSGIGADYIIISHANFLTQVQALANFRTSQGLRVQVVDVQDLYDEFNGGVFSPEAIKSFISYAYANWIAPAPSFVLLVGDGHFDYKNYFGWNEATFIPPYLADVDLYIGETATDNRYVSVSGSDILPDLYIGRFPARTTTEAQTMVDKTINYEQSPAAGTWNTYQTFVADDKDSGGDFPALSDHVINTFIPATYTVDKIYYKVNYTDAGTARTALKNAINQGRLIVHYVGHGSTWQWASENLFNKSDLPSLTNGAKLPFMVPMTCAEGYFIWPNPTGTDYSALGEASVRINGKGAIASWSPTGYGLSSGHALLDDSLFDDLFKKQYNQLGYLTTNAKYYVYAQSSSYHDLIETFMLFGDPALRLYTLPVDAPPAPSNLQATTISSTRIDLSWQDNSSNESEFRIERSPNGSTDWQEIGVVDANVTSYSNTVLSCDTPYYYRVRAYREGDLQFSAYSNTANARTYACRTLNFSSGWNLITLPLTPIQSFYAQTLLDQLNSQGVQCTEVDRWYQGKWNAHYNSTPSSNNFPLSVGAGYFVRCVVNFPWTMEGQALTSGVTVNLVSGWNLVGFPHPSGFNAQGILDGINGQGGSCSEIDRWYQGKWNAHYNSTPTSNNYAIEVNQGYFVKCATSSSFTPSLP